MEKHPLHIKNPELQKSADVQRAVKKEERLAVITNEELKENGQEGPLLQEKIPNDSTGRIESYMDRLKNIFLNPDKRKRSRNLEMFRDKIYDSIIIKKENFPESYFELQQRIARERGQTIGHIPDNVREQMMDVAIQDQKHSLDAWIDYLSSDDAIYPVWFKYYVWTQITKLSQFDKEHGEYKTRTGSTVAPFPDIYREPLAQIADLYESYPRIQKEIEPELQNLRAKINVLRKKLKVLAPEDTGRKDIDDEIGVLKQEIEYASTPLNYFNKKFPSLYAELTQKSLSTQIENKEEVKGEWVKYGQGDMSHAEILYQSLEGKGTGWCTAGKSSAKKQIESGDFYVYYTNDSSGEPTQPRLAIRMVGNNKIGEVRGVLPHQNIEPLMQEVLDKKLSEFGSEADKYNKKSEDMRILTSLDHKKEREEPFTKDELVFLYEINSSIEGFGYEKDPRIAELRKGRDTEKDILVVFGCTKEEIARSPDQITNITKVYVGQLGMNIFHKFPKNLTNIYTSFPDGKIKEERFTLGGNSVEQLILELDKNGIRLGYGDLDYKLLTSRELMSREDIKLVTLSASDLGFQKDATIEQICERALICGLETCPDDTGLNYFLKHPDPHSTKFFICVKGKRVTYKKAHYYGLTLRDFGDDLCISALDIGNFNPSTKFMFCLSKHNIHDEMDSLHEKFAHVIDKWEK